MLIDAGIPGEKNVVKRREDPKILEYKECTIEIERVWTVHTKVVPVTVLVTGTISISLREYLSNVLGK